MSREYLRRAKCEKNDEFFTMRSTIEKEMSFYGDFFKGKTVYCNTDNPYESEFFKYFVLNFTSLGLKKLITTCYAGLPVRSSLPELIRMGQIETGMDVKTAYKTVITGIESYRNPDGSFNEANIDHLLHDAQQNPSNRNSMVRLKETSKEYEPGDFRSEECDKLLDEVDVVITNPPFSLFSEFVEQIMRHGKKFIILGNTNAITYKKIFPLIKDDKIWLGGSVHSGRVPFYVPNYYDFESIDKKTGRKIAYVNTRWFTNVDYSKRYEDIPLVEKYSGNESAYPKYDNYDAINVDRTVDIPRDYAGLMGVPITFLDKYNPSQFEIIGCFNNSDIKNKAKFSYVLSTNTPYINKVGNEKIWNGPTINKKSKYYRIVIRNRRPEID